MPMLKKAITIEEANRSRQSVDYSMKGAMLKAREGNKTMLELLHNDAKVTFELYFEQLYRMIGE